LYITQPALQESSVSATKDDEPTLSYIRR
jgi:hypothetical protein